MLTGMDGYYFCYSHHGMLTLKAIHNLFSLHILSIGAGMFFHSLRWIGMEIQVFYCYFYNILSGVL